ncbi:retropepsin-like aspartic protease family protein [Rhodoplanes serenus]|uniref:retropepsin-like aspartic protease family protein n=1 Tax=Rhodoplanes serenus TaxID=200615 RepID=UPI000DACA12A|nr:TIGR02281 family clan AA aspartic protease [Rhodoplanes serenus]RAI35513.1 TIGR02281 family clan AA aspartic protease [Rhodoplanes serenus]
MRSILVFAALALGLAALVPRLYLDTAPRPQPAAAAVPAAAPVAAPAASAYRTLVLKRDERGHFQVDGRLDGRRMSFLVDTGASVIALRASDAARLGIRPAGRDFTAKVSTANGSVMAAPAEISRVEIGDIVVSRVAALVLPDEALGQNLLGMSFLSRIRFEHRNGRLILEQ